MVKINKCRVIKNGVPLVSKGNEVWFALKSKNMTRADVKEFRVYLNECAEEFLVEEKDASDEETTVGDIEKGQGKTEEAASQRESAPRQEQS